MKEWSEMTAASKTRWEVLLDAEKEYSVSETIRETPLKPSLIFPIPVEESNTESLISYVNQSSITASDVMKVLDQ